MLVEMHTPVCKSRYVLVFDTWYILPDELDRDVFSVYEAFRIRTSIYLY